nr:MAG TPA: hypothetical protein [Caudoviricetes sp.]
MTENSLGDFASNRVIFHPSIQTHPKIYVLRSFQNPT